MIEPKGSVTRRDESGVTDAQARKSALVVAAVLLAIAAWNLYRGRTTVVVAAVLLAIAAWNLYRGRTTVVVIFGSISAALIIAGLFVPVAARAFHKAWMRLAVFLGHVNSRVLLTLMYYLVFTPYGLVSRLFGRDPLARRGKAGESYWVERKRTRQEREQFERLF